MKGTAVCPCCGGTGSAPAADHVAELREWCAVRNHVVLPGDRVSEHVAAEILGRAPGTLRNWASAARPLPFTTIRGRRTYQLMDLAEMLYATPPD